MKRNILKSIIVGALLSIAGLASKFNTNASAASVQVGRAPATKNQRRPSFRTGIKGVAGTNNTRYGAGLKAHFDAKRREVQA